MTGTKLAVNVFEESKTPEQSTPTPQQQNQQPADQPEARTPETTQQENSTTTTQVGAQDDSATMQNSLSISIPWIAAGLVAVVILIALFTILRKLNKQR